MEDMDLRVPYPEAEHEFMASFMAALALEVAAWVVAWILS